MDKGSGGGYDTSGLEKATKKQIALQKEIYEQTRADAQPWYQMGTGATDRLSDLLGISGGSVLDRGQIYDEMLPQYTQQQTSGGTGSRYITPDGRVIDFEGDNLHEFLRGNNNGLDRGIFNAMNAYKAGNLDTLEQYGYSPMQQQTTTDVTDYDALNAAVDARMSSQGTPDDYGSLLKSFSMDDFEQDPSYQFRQDEAQKALERSMAAQGVTLGGGGYGEINPQAARAMEELTQGLASQEYGNAYQRYTADNLNKFNMLMGAAGMGQGSTGIMASAGQNYASGAGQAMTDLAGAQMNAQMAQASQPSMFSQLLNTGAQVAGAYFMSDRRLKTDIKRIGTENDYPVYKFKYKNNPKRTFIGVMAQDVKEINPEAVVTMFNGYDAVDYAAIGVKMREV